MLLFETLLSEESKTEKAIHIYKNYYSYMIYIAGRYLRDSSECEDAAQECMLKLISIIDSIDTNDEARLKGLCGVVTRNTALNICKRSERGNVSLEAVFNVIDNAPDPESIVISNESLRALVNAVERLNPIYRDVLKLKYFNQLKEREIAKLLDLPQKTVNQRIFRGKTILRNAIKEEGLNG
ncbi:MAG: sigma-70 family RNA polymerase sigma factor [Clostridia bacterium]|nr:sigma-70 family RNA polymerase sigma factor [Clostridia bacterium]